MKFATYEIPGAGQRVGVVDAPGERLHPLPEGVDLLGLIRQGGTALAEAGERALAEAAGPGASVSHAEVRILAPFSPPTVRDFVAFEEHVEGVTRSLGDSGGGVVPEWYQAPTFYFTNPYAVIGPYDDVAVPPGSSLLDFELEVAAVIGKEGCDLSPDQAAEHVVGYMIFNDWSARDLQAREMAVRLGPCKGKDSATTLGPWLVTADELEPYRDGDGFLRLGMVAEVNGVEIGRDLLSNMGWPFEDLIAYASRGTYVRPGDVLGSGTCGNGGCLAELWGLRGELAPPPLRPGDTVTLTVEGIGTVRNTVVPGVAPRHVPPARKRSRERP